MEFENENGWKRQLLGWQEMAKENEEGSMYDWKTN